MDKWRKHFDELALKFGGSVKSNNYYNENHAWSMNSIVSSFLEKNRTNIIVDVGCGNGFFSENYCLNNVVYGIDISGIMLRHAKNKGLHPIQSDALSMPLISDFSDMTLCISAIQLFNKEQDVNQCLEELIRITKPGGTIILATINAESLARKVFSLIRKDEGLFFERMYSVSDIINKFKRLNIDTREIYFFYLPLSYMNKSLSPGFFHRVLSATFLIVGRKQL